MLGGHSGLSFANRVYTTSANSRGISARPNTLFQPKASARPGANKAASAVPELPAPAIPSALNYKIILLNSKIILLDSKINRSK